MNKIIGIILTGLAISLGGANIYLNLKTDDVGGDFTVLQNIEKRNFQVIFQTAYDQFAIRAFEESACDYLLKPYEAERLEKALQKAIKGLETRQLNDLESNLRKSEKFI